MNYIIVTVLASGIYLVFYDEFYLIYRSCFRSSKAFYRHYRIEEKELIDKSNLAKLIKATLGMEHKKAVHLFIIFSFFITILFYTLVSKNVGAELMIVSTLIVFMMPYAVLKIKLSFTRIQNANEGDIVIRETINAYNLTGKNMRATIEYLAVNMINAKHMKGLMINLSKKINNASDEEDIKDILENFRYKVNTSWVDILCMNIRFSIIKGIDITEPLLDLSKAIENSKINKEKIKQESNEGSIMITVVAPICYILTVVSSLTFFQFSLIKFVKYQFLTEVGIKWFLIVIATYIIGLITRSYINDGKLDI